MNITDEHRIILKNHMDTVQEYQERIFSAQLQDPSHLEKLNNDIKRLDGELIEAIKKSSVLDKEKEQ